MPLRNIAVLFGGFLCFLYWQARSFRLVRHTEALRKAERFFLGLREGIRTLRKNIFDLIAEDKSGFSFFREVRPCGELLYVYYLKAKELNYASSGLEGEDEAVLERFFSQFGESDRVSQLRLCTEAMTELEKRRTEAEERQKRLCRLYSGTGIGCGILFCILMI